MNQNFIDGIVGWSAGYVYSNEKNREDEVKQGKNYYLGALTFSAQLSQFAVLISKINQTLPQHGYSTPVRILCNVGPILSVPAFLFFASVKQGEYENIAHWFNGTKYAYVKLPEKLSGRTVTFLSFFAEHSGNMIRVAVVAASVSLIALGSTVYGAAVLTALTYEVVDTLGFVPRRISLFMEIYMPTVSLIGMTLRGNGFGPRHLCRHAFHEYFSVYSKIAPSQSGCLRPLYLRHGRSKLDGDRRSTRGKEKDDIRRNQ